VKLLAVLDGGTPVLVLLRIEDATPRSFQIACGAGVFTVYFLLQYMSQVKMALFLI
jgi:hypothetical protein